MSKTIFTIALATAMMTVASGVAIAQETVKMSSVVPSAGLTEWVGTHTFTFPSEPTRNEECMEIATLSMGETLISSISTVESARLQQKVEGLNDRQIAFVFNTKKITTPGIYTISIPEGFLTFENGTKVNAAIELKYTISEGEDAILVPAPGYYPDGVPYNIEITFPGIESITDNHQAYDSDTGLGGIRFETPANMYQSYSVEGNKVILTPGSKEFTTAGEYRVIISAGALTFNYSDGSSKESTLMFWNYMKPVFPMPEVSFLEDPDQVYGVPNKVVLTLPEGFTWGQVMRPAALWYATDKGEYDKDKGALRAYQQSYEDLPRGKRECNLYDGQEQPLTSDKPVNLILRWDKACVSASGPVYDPELHNTDYYNPNGTRKPGDVIEVFNDVAYLYRFTLKPHPGVMDFQMEETVGPLDHFPIYFPGADFVEVNPDCEKQPCIMNFAGNKVQEGYTVTLETPEYPVALAEDGEKEIPFVMAHVTPTFTPAKKVRYRICLPENAVTINGKISSPETVHIVYVDPSMIPTAVEEVEVAEPAAVTVTVVDLSGKVLIENGAPADLMSLPAGIYVINGQTTLLR